MVRKFLFHNKTTINDPSWELIREELQNTDCLIWVSLEQPDDSELQTILADIFHFHPLAVEDCQSTGYQSPKVDDYGSYIFLIMQAITASHDLSLDSPLQTMELNLFLGENFLVTSHHADTMRPVEQIWKRLEIDDRLYHKGSDFLCHAVLDVLVDDYLPLIDQLEDEIEWLEDMVVARPAPMILQRILKLKHTIMSLRRIISPQREVVNRLSRDDFPQIDRQFTFYYRDIYDHLVRIQDLSDSIRDIVSGALDIYLNSTSLRLNEIMKALTIVSTIFLPLTFVAGVYGMNFEYMPEISWRWGYLTVWVVFILIFGGMVYYFNHKKWF